MSETKAETRGLTMKIKLAELIADEYVAGLDMASLTPTQILILHGIKSVAMGDWARRELAILRGRS